MITEVWSEAEHAWVRYDATCRRGCCDAAQRLAAVGNRTRRWWKKENTAMSDPFQFSTVEPTPVAGVPGNAPVEQGAEGAASPSGPTDPAPALRDLALRLRYAAHNGEPASATRVVVRRDLLIEAAEALEGRPRPVRDARGWRSIRDDPGPRAE